MAKKSETSTPETPAVVAAAVPVETPVTTETAAIAPANVTAITPALAAQQALAARVPEAYREDVLFLQRPTPDEFMHIISELPADMQEKMMALVAKTRPKKQGAHTTATGFSPTSIKLFHGMGADPARPEQTIAGQFYTGDSRVIGKKFDGVPLGFYQGRILWPAAGSESESKAPICVSADRKTGSKYGVCGTCALASRPYNQGGCTREVTYWLLDRDLTGIYELKFSKSSGGAGESMVAVLQKGENIWDRWFTFETQERTEGKNRWFVQKASPSSESGGAATPKVLHKLFSAFSRILDADVYYPLVADVADRLKNNPDSTGGKPVSAETFNEKAFIEADTAGNPDYSKDV